MELRRVRMLLVPTQEQEKKFWTYVYYFRKTYNLGLEWVISNYEATGTTLFFNDLSAMLTEYKTVNTDFYQVDSHTLKQAMQLEI